MKGLLKSAIRDDNPTIVFEHGGLGRLKEEVPDGDHLVPLGKAAVKREGDQLTVVAIGAMVPKAEGRRKTRQGKHLRRVVDPRTLIPLDEDTISLGGENQSRVVADEGHLRGGAASDLAAIIGEKGFDFLDAPVKRVASLDVPIPFSPPLEKAAIATRRESKQRSARSSGAKSARDTDPTWRWKLRCRSSD